MATRFELPMLDTHAGKWLKVNPTETGYLWDAGAPPIAGGYFYLAEDGIVITQRDTINFTDFFTLSDNLPNSDVTLNTASIANDSTFLSNLYSDTNLDLLISNTYFTSNLAIDNTFITYLSSNDTFIDYLTANSYFTTNISGLVSVSTDGVTITGDGTVGNPLVAVIPSSTTFFIDQTPDNGTYGLVSGDVNGINQTYTVSQSGYISGKLMVFKNGLMQLQGATDDWREINPSAGTFQFLTAPATGSIITVNYQK